MEKDIANVKLQTDAVLLSKMITPFQQHFGLTEGGCFSLTAEKCLTLGECGGKQIAETSGGMKAGNDID